MSRNLRFIQSRYLRIGGAVVALAALLSLVGGCSGSSSSGGDTGTSSTGAAATTATVTLNGTITGAAAGWYVAFDQENVDGINTTTDASGNYTLQVPAVDIPSSGTLADYLTVADPSGNIWSDSPATVTSAGIVSGNNVTLPAYDTASGTVLLSTGKAASGHIVIFKSAGKFTEPSTTSGGTGYTVNEFFTATTGTTGAYTLNIPVTLNLEGTTYPVITAVKSPATTSADLYYVVDSSYVQWVTATNPPGTYPYTYSPTLSSSAVTALISPSHPLVSGSLKDKVKANLKALLGSH